MAIINEMERIEHSTRNLRQSTIRKSVYSLAKDGLQVKSFGSARRQNPDMVSQSMYFKGKALDQLRDALIEIYGSRGDSNTEDQHKNRLLKSFSNVDSTDIT